MTCHKLMQDIDKFDSMARSLGAGMIIGQGMESYVFEYKDNKILRIFKDNCPNELERTEKLYHSLRKYDLPFDLPRIFSKGIVQKHLYCIEPLFSGSSLDLILPLMHPDDKQIILGNLITALKMFKTITLDDMPCGELIHAPPMQCESWCDFMLSKLDQLIQEKESYLPADKGWLMENMENVIRQHEPLQLGLVHGDMFPGNVIVNAEDMTINAFIDFSRWSLKGDHLLDIVASLIYLELCPGYQLEDTQIMRDIIKKEYPELDDDLIRAYAFYYALLFVDIDDPLYPDLGTWCLKHIDNFSKT